MSLFRIYADFNSRTDDGDSACWILTYNGKDLEPQLDALGLREGDLVILYQEPDDFEITARLERRFVEWLGRETLVAVPDPSTLVRLHAE